MFIVYIPVFIELLGDLVQVVSLPLQLRINFFDPIRIYDLFLRECFNDVLLLALPRLLHLFFNLRQLFLAHPDHDLLRSWVTWSA